VQNLDADMIEAMFVCSLRLMLLDRQAQHGGAARSAGRRELRDAAALDTSIHEVRIQRATVEERRYLRAMAELGEGLYRSGQVAAMLGRTPPAVSMTRSRLIEKGLIYATEDPGHVDYTVPRFGAFLRRHAAYLPPAQRRFRSER
jgi:hypothetical protein